MHSILLVMALGAVQDLWLAPSNRANQCEAAAFAHALHVLRPTVQLHEGLAPDGGLGVALERAGSAYIVRVTGPDLSFSRTFPDRNDCEATSWTGALLVDGALNELALPTDAPQLGDIAAPRPPRPLELAVLAGGGIEQGPLKAAPAASVGLRLTRGVFEAALDGEWLPQESHPVGSSIGGDYVASQFGGELVAGAGWRRGRIRVSADGLVGLSVVDAEVSASSPLFQREPVALPTVFGGLRAALTVDLPARFLVTAWFEERWSPEQTAVYVEGSPQAHFTTRQWVAAGLLAAGWRFY